MKSRLLVAAVGIPLLLIILFVCPKIVAALAISILSAIGARELLHTTGLVSHNRMLIYSMMVACFVPIWSYIGCPILLGAAIFMVFVMILFFEALHAYPAIPFATVTECIFGAVVIPLCLGSMVRILLPSDGRYLVLIPIMIPFLTDAGAYFVGCSIGRHKLAPTLSPHKTLEGAAGGLLAGIVSMLLYGVVIQLIFARNFCFTVAVVYGVVGAIVSMMGDLAFSMIKRETGIKDYGTIFKAHGGVLDRFDSVIFAAPVVELLLLLLPVIG